MKRLAVFLLALLAIRCGSNPIAPSTASWFAPSLPTTDARFDATFYNELVHGTLEAPSMPARRLWQSPSVYLQRTGLSDAFVAQIEQTIREEIPAFTGNALHLAQWETGTALKPDTDGWIVIELRDDAGDCGRTIVGASAGHVIINTADKCLRRDALLTAIFAHEIGHALGFYHVDAGLMQAYVTVDQTLTERERFHGAVAYGH